MTDQSGDTDWDFEQVREKYRQERQKRVVAQGGRGVVDLQGDLSRYLDDPYMEANPREPITDEVEVLCIGAGFAGLLVGARMKEAGVKTVRLVDSAGDVGGVWYWNRYPDAKCDVESLIYMPLLEETGYIPTMRYAAAPEIGEHARRIARHFDLYEHAVFHTTITEIVWDENLVRWHVHTDRGDDMLAQFVVTCNGPMSRVKLPDIPGLDSFRGKSFHTSRWDYEYTGGSPTDPKLDKLHDKVVGFIGTGATGLQCVSPLGHSAKQFYLFQRTPSTVGVRANGPIDPHEVRSFELGWQKRRLENFTRINFGETVDTDLIQDGWTDLYGALHASPRYHGLSGDALAKEKERVDFEKMEAIRQRIGSVVKNPETAERLKPYYNYMCKRAGWHDEYLETFNLPNVTLVDTEGQGVERIDETGVFVQGKKYELDCLIFGTGFEVELAGRGRIGFDIVGRGGLQITNKWKNGLSTLHGLMTSKFPNLFMIPGLNAQAVVTTNVVHMTKEYAAHIAYIVKSMRERDAQVFDVSEDAEQAWVQTILDKRIDRTAFLAACTPGRSNFEGDVNARPPQNTVYGGGPTEYFQILHDWREQEHLPGLQLAQSHADADRLRSGCVALARARAAACGSPLRGA